MNRILMLFLLLSPLISLAQTTPQQAVNSKNYNATPGWQIKDWPEGNRIWMTPAERLKLTGLYNQAKPKIDSVVGLRDSLNLLKAQLIIANSSISLLRNKADTLAGKGLLNQKFTQANDGVVTLQNAVDQGFLGVNNSISNLINRADTLIGVKRGRALFKGSENVTIDPVDGTIRVTAPGSVTLADVNSTPGTFGSQNKSTVTTYDSKGRAIQVQEALITPAGIGAATPAQVTAAASSKADSIRAYRAISGKGGAMRLSQLRGQATAQRSIFLTDKLRGGTFVLDSTDTSTPDDGALTLVDVSGNRYKRYLADGRITPQMFGAVGDSLTDDAAALSAWLNATTTYSWYLPAGKYRSSTALSRTNKGAFALATAGSGKSKICFSGDTDGLSIVNPLNGLYGKIEVQGLTIESVSAKSAGRIALTITSQNEQQPGADLTDISLIGRAGKEWTKALIFRDCSGIRIDQIYVEGGGINTTTGLILVNNPSRPMVNLEFGKVYMRAVKLGVEIVGTGTPAVEGVSFAQLKLVGVRRGMSAISNSYTAPLIDLSGAHIDAYEQCLYTKNFSQINFGANSLFYITTLSGVTPDTAAVRLDNPQTVTGTLTLNLMAPSKYGVYAGGSGSGIDMGLAVVRRYGESVGVFVEQSVGTTRWRILNSWGGLGNNTGTAIIDKSNQAILEGMPVEDSNVSVVRTIFGAGILDGNTLQAQHILIPSSEAGKTINTIYHRYSGQIITIMTDASVTIHHAPGSIFLSAQKDMVLPYKGRMTLLRTAQGQWEEIATVLPTTPTSATVDQSKNVQGISAKSRADYSTVANQDRPSGFSTINASAGMPIDPTGFNLWLTTTSRYEDGTGNASYWLSQITANLKSGLLFHRSYDGQLASYSAWKAIHTNRWFPVDTAGGAAPTTGKVLMGNGSTWTGTVLSAAIDTYLNSIPGRVAGTNQILGRDSTNTLRYFSLAGSSTAPAATTADYSTTGTVISDGGGYFNNDASSSPSAVFDKNINTGYDANDDAAGKYVGRNLGAAYAINTIRVLPRQNYQPDRLNGARIQWSSNGTSWTDLYTITGVSESNKTSYVVWSGSITAQYIRVFWSSVGSYGNVNEVQILKQ